jgi:hypothetical protein
MLADDIAAAAKAASPDYLWAHSPRTLADSVRNAQHLVLRRDVVQTAQYLACSRPSSMGETIEMAIPPYPDGVAGGGQRRQASRPGVLGAVKTWQV